MHQISFPAFVQQGQLSTRAGVNSKGSVGPLLADGPPACNLHVLPAPRFGGVFGLRAGRSVSFLDLRPEFSEPGSDHGAGMDAPAFLPAGGHASLLCSYSFDCYVKADGWGFRE